MQTTIHQDGTVTFWDVYSQQWKRCAAEAISDESLAALSADDRAKVVAKQERDQLRKRIVNQIAEIVGSVAIASHEPGYEVVKVYPDGEVVKHVRIDRNDSEQTPDGKWIMELVTVGTGSCACNCDACSNGDDPAAWADEDGAGYLESEMIRKLDSISEEYWE